LPDIVWSLKGLDGPCGDVTSSKTSYAVFPHAPDICYIIHSYSK